MVYEDSIDEFTRLEINELATDVFGNSIVDNPTQTISADPSPADFPVNVIFPETVSVLATDR